MADEVSLREYFERRLDDLDREVNIAISAQDKATKVAYETMEKRLQSMNEFRDTLRDQAARFTTRDEMNLITDRLEADIKNLESARSQMLTVQTYDTAHRDLQKQVEDLKLSRAVLEGKATQESVARASNKAQWGIVFGAVGTSIAIINFLSRVFP